jgi:hypothetical protein
MIPEISGGKQILPSGILCYNAEGSGTVHRTDYKRVSDRIQDGIQDRIQDRTEDG